jgi:hypothetical protein
VFANGGIQNVSRITTTREKLRRRTIVGKLYHTKQQQDLSAELQTDRKLGCLRIPRIPTKIVGICRMLEHGLVLGGFLLFSQDSVMMNKFMKWKDEGD